MNNRWDTDLQKNLATFHEEFCQITLNDTLAAYCKVQKFY